MGDYIITDICGDYALTDKATDQIFIFNSLTNAETVKRILEVDGSKPNVATVCDMEEIVRCKNCKNNPNLKTLTKGMLWCRKFRAEVHQNDYCSYGERKDGAK